MKLKLQDGIRLLEEELSQLDTAVRNFENNGGNGSLLDEALVSKISDNLSKLQLPTEINKLTTYSNSLSQKIQNVQNKLEYLESNLYNDNASLSKEISKDMEMILTGVNSTNHYLMALVNENEKRYNEMEDRLNDIKKKNRATLWLVNSLILFIIFALMLNFGIFM